MLFRAICRSTAPACQDGPVIAYVEASRRDLAAYKLALILATMWAVPADTIHFHAIDSEVQLRSHAAITHGSDLDVALLEISGTVGQAVCAAAPLFLVGAAWRARLSAALMRAHRAALTRRGRVAVLPARSQLLALRATTRGQ